jgi:hypothetical protein
VTKNSELVFVIYFERLAICFIAAFKILNEIIETLTHTLGDLDGLKLFSYFFKEIDFIKVAEAVDHFWK